MEPSLLWIIIIIIYFCVCVCVCTYGSVRARVWVHKRGRVLERV
jgi:hypothetical protein